jgi:hypothetical protein
MLKKARHLTHPTRRAETRRPAGKAAASLHAIRGSRDDPNCARPTSDF